MSKKYSEYLEINPSFESVVDIDADKRNANLWRDYIIVPDMTKLVDVLCQSLGNEAPDARRSFWIEGSYGTGKSYAAIFVKHLMEEKPEVVEEFMASRPRLAPFKNRFMKCRKKGDYLVVWKTGCTGIRTGDMMLIEAEKAIQDALIEKYGDKADLGSASLITAIIEKLNDPSINWDFMLQTTTLGNDYVSVEDLREQVEGGSLSAIQATANVLRQKNMGLVNNLETFEKWVAEVIDNNHLDQSGIFFIWDEFTEYVAYSDDHTVMQQLSEFCKVKPFFTFFIVHKSSDLVARVGGENQYQLIIHRFHPVEFHLTADASLDLIESCINRIHGMDEYWKEAKKEVIDNIHPFLPDMTVGLDDRMAERIDYLCPMHPMTIRLLSRVAENYAAAERTMFRFMKDRSNDSIGFNGYIHQYGPEDQACWLTPEWLWDYVFTRESDFHDKDRKVAEYIHHYVDKRDMVVSNPDAHRVFKVAMLLMAVMSSAKGIYGGNHAQGGISATVGCLELCLAGVMSKTVVEDLLETLVDCKLLVLDKATNGTVRLQLPFSNDGGSFQARYDANDKKYSRYQMFSKDGVFAKAFEEQAWDENDATLKRMKICACCAETLSIKSRLEEIQKELDKYPYKLGLLIVIVRDDAQHMAIQSDLQQRAVQSQEPRLTIALIKKPLEEKTRTDWLNAITKQEMANESGQTGAASQARMEAQTIISTWASSAASGSTTLTAWNGSQVFSNQYGMANLQKTIRFNVLQKLFPYAPELFIVRSTAYKVCNDPAVLAGIQRQAKASPYTDVLYTMEPIKKFTSIDDMAEASGNKVADAVSPLAKLIRSELLSGQKIVLNELWSKLQEPPFGYYDTIACGILLGYVFSASKIKEFSWTDNVQSTHILGEQTLKNMILNMVKGKMTTDYLSSGTIEFQRFREYVKAIMKLTDVQVANETECWHNMREAVTKAGAPFWTLKYLPDNMYGSVDFKEAAMKIVDQIQLFIAQNTEHEEIMSTVIQLFNGRGKLRVSLSNAFQDKHVLSAAFRSFLFDASPKLKAIADKLSIQPEELSDKLHFVMQDAIYSWTEDQVKEKLEDVVSEYTYLDALNTALGKVYHSVEEARKDLLKLFGVVRIPMAAVETLDKPWFDALKAMYKVSQGGAVHMSQEERTEDVARLTAGGKAAMDFLKDGKAALSDLLEKRNLECTLQETETIYAGLKDMTVDSTLTQFEKELTIQNNKINQARNRIMLQEQWVTLTGCETVKEWCSAYGAPLLWIVSKEERKALGTLISVQNSQRTLDQDVISAIHILKGMDLAILTDKKTITEALLKIVGPGYQEVFEAERDQIIAKAKMQLGNDMSTWDIDGLRVLQQLLKQAQQEKAKREKLSNTKNHVQSMNETTLRNTVTAFLDAHPEFCDDFSK